MKPKKKNKKSNCFDIGGNISTIGNIIQSTGALDINYNPADNAVGLQKEINQAGGIGTGDVASEFLQNLTGANNAVLGKIEQFGNQAVQGNTMEDVMNNYSNFNPLQQNNYNPSKNIGGEIADTLQDTAKYAIAGAKFGGVGAAIGGGVGLALNLGNKLFASNRRDKINKAVIEANNTQNRMLDQNLEKVNTNNAYNMMSNYFADGGQLDEQSSLGLTFINNGGTHEQNPNGGVPQGVDPNGAPNLVEEGEVKTSENYVFSDRNKPSIEILEQVGLPINLKKLSFAEIAKLVSKEAAERPNDPISKKGLETQLGRLKQAQEMYNQQEFQKRMETDPEFREQVLAQQEAQAQQAQMQDQQTQQQTKQQPQELQQTPTQQPEQNMFAIGGPMNHLFNPEMANNIAKLKRNSQNVGLDGQLKINKINPWTLEDEVEYEYLQKNNPQKIKTNTLEIAEDLKNNTNIKNDIKRSASVVVPNIQNKNNTKINATDLRYAPALANAGMLGYLASTDADYSNADPLVNMRSDRVSAEPLRDYMKYNPLDSNYALNQLHQQQASSRAGLANASGGNRATYLASVLGSDYNYGLNEGTALRQATEYNDAKQKQVAEFNRGTNQYNSQSKLQADSANQSANLEANKLNSKGYMMRQQIYDSRQQDIASAISGVAENLGTIGFSEFNINMANSMNKYIVDKNTGELRLKTPEELAGTANTEANGGKIKTTKIKINKGLTYEF